MLYEIKCFGADPFDVMCGDCPVNEIEWWEGTTLEELHSLHDEQMAMDAATPDWEVREMQEQGEWNPTSPDFDAWLEQSITNGYVRITV